MAFTLKSSVLAVGGGQQQKRAKQARQTGAVPEYGSKEMRLDHMEGEQEDTGVTCTLAWIAVS